MEVYAFRRQTRRCQHFKHVEISRIPVQLDIEMLNLEASTYIHLILVPSGYRKDDDEVKEEEGPWGRPRSSQAPVTPVVP